MCNEKTNYNKKKRRGNNSVFLQYDVRMMSL